MGSGSRFHSGLSTRGGLENENKAEYAGKSISNNPLVKQLLDKGVKINLNDTLFVAKDKTGLIVWLEKGSSKAGLNHILNGDGKTPGHADDFKKAFGVSRSDVPKFLKNVISNGKLVSNKTIVLGSGKVGYERIYYYNGSYHLVTGIGTNGYIVSAYPIKKKK